MSRNTGETDHTGATEEIRIGEAELGQDPGFEERHRIVFPHLRTVDYRVSVHGIAEHLLTLLRDGSGSPGY